MNRDFFALLRSFGLGLALITAPGFGGGFAQAEPRHGIAMYGEPALPPDFVSLPYANPDAPKGGRLVVGENGSFDSLHPFIVKGRAPTGISLFTTETLLGRSFDEPFSLYGILAESVETDTARTYVEFTLREAARFSDGSPVTVEDVLWSFEALGTLGNPRYAPVYQAVAKAEKTGDRKVKFTFGAENRELPLLLGMRPVLQKAQWEGRDFSATTMVPPIGSGPYVVDRVEAGRFVSYKKNPDWWGKDLPFYRGQHNLDEVRVEYFGNPDVHFEAFKSGELNSYRETNPEKWATHYNLPAIAAGAVVKSEIPHQRPSGMDGFAFNTRKPIFADWRVREALILVFNFELINQTINGGAVPRITSYYSNSELAGDVANPAQGKVLALLEPYKAELLPGALEGYALPVSDGKAANRGNLRKASALLDEAGWTVQDGVRKDAAGKPLAFEILLVNGADGYIAAANIYIQALKQLGVDAKLTTVDQAQYTERTNVYDFDMTQLIVALSLSPGTEQLRYWGSANGAAPGSRNFAGVNAPVVDALVQTQLSSTDRADFVTAVQALDRVLTSGRYVVPLWYQNIGRIAHAKQLHFPEKLPIYGDWPGFQPEVWWYQE
ncbi:MAG: extracellular solute-binding protein [Cypionkella sp.]|uniref:extracellular solute-binding protein n=1 Tax=Cypionkella sp. TaxID=2811411 RepID=UPI002AB9F031|nr:extracellular solute-binding protein [Cypionkella sp.]MDZ4312447.1 extracellular solute-binding protein [Cypionkella sp.]